MVQGALVVGRTVYLCQVGIVQVVKREVWFAKHALHGNMFIYDALSIMTYAFGSLFVHAVDNAVFIVRYSVDQSRVENVLIAQHGVLLLLLAQSRGSDVGDGADDNRGASAPVTLHHREVYRESLGLLAIAPYRLQLQRLAFLFL